MNTTGGRLVRLLAAASIVLPGFLGSFLAAPASAAPAPHEPLGRKLAQAVRAYDLADARLVRIQARLDIADRLERPRGRRAVLLRLRRDLHALARARARIEEPRAAGEDRYRTLTERMQVYQHAIALAERKPPAKGPSIASAASTAIAAARSVLGAPYVYGSAGPGAFDCSGLTMWAYAQAGVVLPHSALAQYAAFPRVPLAALRPGDIVYYGNFGPHVALYLGHGMIIHATHPGGGGGVHIDSLYGYDRPWGAVRPS